MLETRVVVSFLHTSLSDYTKWTFTSFSIPARVRKLYTKQITKRVKQKLYNKKLRKEPIMRRKVSSHTTIVRLQKRDWRVGSNYLKKKGSLPEIQLIKKFFTRNCKLSHFPVFSFLRLTSARGRSFSF